MVREVPLIIVYNGGLYLDFLPTRARYTADYTASISAFFLLIMQDYTCGIEFIMAKQITYTTLEVCGTKRNNDGAHTIYRWCPFRCERIRFDRIGIDMWIEVTEDSE